MSVYFQIRFKCGSGRVPNPLRYGFCEGDDGGQEDLLRRNSSASLWKSTWISSQWRVTFFSPFQVSQVLDRELLDIAKI